MTVIAQVLRNVALWPQCTPSRATPRRWSAPTRRWRARPVASRPQCGRRTPGGKRAAMAGSTVVPLVGRSEELGRVLAALERAAAGAGGALLLAGDAGIGKSRLAMEALTLVRQRGFVTLEAAAYPLQADLAYAPVLEALGPFLAV